MNNDLAVTLFHLMLTIPVEGIGPLATFRAPLFHPCRRVGAGSSRPSGDASGLASRLGARSRGGRRRSGVLTGKIKIELPPCDSATLGGVTGTTTPSLSLPFQGSMGLISAFSA
jgi:hypothetical protein